MLFKSILIAGFLCIFIVGVCANALVILLSFKPVSSVNVNVNTLKTYIVNMAAADLFYIFGCLFYTLTNYNQDGWLFGDVGCRLILSIDIITMHVSVCLLAVMSVERYIAVVHPMLSLRYRSVGFARGVVVIIWVTALVLATPMLISMRLARIDDDDLETTKCTCTWTLHGANSLSAYMISVFLITFMIPSLIIAIAYGLLVAHFGCTPTAERNSSQQVRRSKRRAAQIVFLVVIVFWVCYTPFWVYQLAVLFVEGFDPKQIIGLVTLVISYLNSCVNPFLYTLLPRRYNVWQKMRRQSSFATPKYRITGRPEACDSV